MTAWGYVRLWAVASTGAPNVPGRGAHRGPPSPQGGGRGVSWCPTPATPRPRVVQPKLAHEWVDNAPPPPGGPCFSFVSHGAAECRRRSPPEVPRTLPADRTADGDGAWGWKGARRFGRCIDFDRVDGKCDGIYVIFYMNVFGFLWNFISEVIIDLWLFSMNYFHIESHLVLLKI